MGIVVDPGQQSPGHALMEFSFQWGKADNKQIKKKIQRMSDVYMRSEKSKEGYRGSRILEVASTDE